MALGNFTIKKVAPERIFRNELTLESESGHSSLKIRENLESLAQNLQNLVIMERGTYPNDPTLGVGIQNYIYELDDAETINALEQNIKSQISHYIQYSNLTVDVHVEAKSTMGNPLPNSVNIRFNIQPNDSDIDGKFSEAYSVDLAVAMNSQSSRLVTKLEYS